MGFRGYTPQETLGTNSMLVHFSREEVYIFPQLLQGKEIPHGIKDSVVGHHL